MEPNVQLDDGLVLRGARVDDLEQIGELLTARGEAADAEDLRLVVDDADEGLGAVMVVADGDRIVSTATLLRESVTIGDVAVPTGQVELVATEPSHEGRGLVRSLMDEAHRRSTARGDLLQVMIGIPFFYRQFGYSYSMPIPQEWRVHTVPSTDPAITMRRATVDDLPALSALQSAAQSSSDVRMPHSAACWRWMVHRSGGSYVVAELDGEVIACARQTLPDEGIVLGEVAGRPDGVRALIAAAQRVAGGPVSVVERPASGLDATLAGVADPPEAPDRSRHWFYARVFALAPLLDHLRPVLLDRFRSSGIGGHHEVLISSFRSHVRFTIDDDAMSAVAAGGPLQAPVSRGGSGVPPDLLAPLLLGPYGAGGLEARHGDVLLGRQRALVEALFPPMSSDLLTFYFAT